MATFYVTPTGSDSNNGTSISTSKLTINGAIQAIGSVSYGDRWDQNEVRVYSSASGPATYYGKHASYSSNIINTGQGNKYGTTVVAAGPYDVILDCSNKTRGAYLSYYSTVRGFYFTASNQSARTTDSTFEAQYSTTQYRLEDCTFDACTDTDSTCVQPGGGNTRADQYETWIKRCTFKNLDCTSAIYGSSKQACVYESILVYDSTFDYEAVRMSADTSETGLIRHVTVDGCTTGRDVIKSFRADIVNCIVSNCAVNSSYRFFDQGNVAMGTIKNCLAYNNTTSSGSFFGSGDPTENVKTGDPLYTDRAGKDFTLQTTSPAKNAGSASVDTGSGLFDLLSASFGSPPSLGAYKFTTVAAPLTVTFTMRGSTFNFKGNNNSFTIKG